MKKTNTSVTKITVFFIFLLVLVVGYYAYLSGTHRTEQQEAVMSEIDTFPKPREQLSFDTEGSGQIL